MCGKPRAKPQTYYSLGNVYVGTNILLNVACLDVSVRNPSSVSSFDMTTGTPFNPGYPMFMLAHPIGFFITKHHH